MNQVPVYDSRKIALQIALISNKQIALISNKWFINTC